MRLPIKNLAVYVALVVLGVSPLTATEDRHFIQGEDYFFSEEPLGDNAWIHVYLGKMLVPPSDKTRGEALFLRVTDGRKIRTKHFLKTRIAGPSDLTLDQKVVVFDRMEDGIYAAPRTKESARTQGWFLAVITDLSDLSKDFVTTSGGYRVSVRGLRVIADERAVRPVHDSGK
ncbi:MAG: hypothetical protein HY042_09480 [Spirochaetia bacterium]|nr:hypothetical protein [Spirochaetia bacterium]